MQKDLKDLIRKRHKELKGIYGRFPVLYEDTVLIIELGFLLSMDNPEEKIEWWFKRELVQDSPYQRVVNELRSIMKEYEYQKAAEKRSNLLKKATEALWEGADIHTAGNTTTIRWEQQKSLLKRASDEFRDWEFPYPESACTLPENESETKSNSIMEKTTKKYFHTFRYQNGNVDRDITIAVVGIQPPLNVSQIKVVIGYAVRTPEDRPDAVKLGHLEKLKEAEEKSRELGKGISLGRAMKTPLEKCLFPLKYANERSVLRAIALKWERDIRKNGAHGYIKGVPE